MDPPHSFSQTPTFVQSPATTATALHDQSTSLSSSQWPSHEQQRGIAALSTLDDADIFSNLATLRSVAPHLTNQQLGALVCLRSAHDEYIKTWLDYSGRFSGSIQSERSSLVSNLSDPRFSTASCSTDKTSLSGLSSISQSVAASKSLALNEIAQFSTAQHEVESALDLNKPQPPLPQGLSDRTVAAQESHSSKHGPRHNRWCTTREHKTVFTTYRGFAKHENEHDNSYVFLPQGPTESTPWGIQCALCETTNPSKAHLQDHNILQYDGWLGKPITRSRKGNFEELLKKHKVSDEKIKLLLNKWRGTKKKNAYSCGFCISIFKTLPERSSHIDREHYAKGKRIDDWKDTYVIKGLLLQREVQQECLRLFHPVDPTLIGTKISWPPSVVDDLQLRLELGEEAAADLAIDVFCQASWSGKHSFSRSSAASNLGPRLETTGCSTQLLPSFERDSVADHSQFLNQDSNSSEGTQAQEQAYSKDLNTMGISLMSVSSPTSMSQPLATSSGFPPRSTSLAASTTGHTGFIYPMSKDAYDTARIPVTPRMPHDVLWFHDSDHMGADGSSSPEHSQFVASIPGCNPPQYSSFNATTSEMVLHTIPPSQSFQENGSQPPVEPSIPIHAPKRKLSDKSVKEANFKAQTQAPLSTGNEQYSIHSRRLRESNAQAIRAWHSSC